MPKFKVGDKVRMMSTGEVCTIKSIDDDFYCYNLVEGGSWEDEGLELVEYENEWHLNDGSPIPRGADTLEKDGSVVAYRKVKEPEVTARSMIMHCDSGGDLFYSMGDCGTVRITTTLTDGKLSDVKAEVVD